jgi:hypothetical protein
MWWIFSNSLRFAFSISHPFYQCDARKQKTRKKTKIVRLRFFFIFSLSSNQWFPGGCPTFPGSPLQWWYAQWWKRVECQHFRSVSNQNIVIEPTYHLPPYHLPLTHLSPLTRYSNTQGSLPTYPGLPTFRVRSLVQSIYIISKC